MRICSFPSPLASGRRSPRGPAASGSPRRRGSSLAHPIHIAEDAATLDVISNGRLEFGVARASLDEQAHDAFRSPLDESRQRFQEALEIILRAWMQESFSYDGKFYQIPQVSVSPKPLQKPHPPVYVVAVSPQTVAFAGRSGHCVYLPGTRTLSELDETSQHYWEHRHQAGYNGVPGALSVNRFIYVSRRRPRSARKQIEGPFLEFIDRHAPDLKAALHEKYAGASLDYDRMVNDFCIFGSPDTVATRLRELHHQLGATYVAVQPEPDHAGSRSLRAVDADDGQRSDPAVARNIGEKCRHEQIGAHHGLPRLRPRQAAHDRRGGAGRHRPEHPHATRPTIRSGR